VIPPPGVALDTVASAATAAGTLVLAFVTYKMVRNTADVAETGKLAAQAAAVEADATRRLVELERDQMRDARLPIVMPIASVGLGDTQNGEVVMTMPVENIGVGPAWSSGTRTATPPSLPSRCRWSRERAPASASGSAPICASSTAASPSGRYCRFGSSAPSPIPSATSSGSSASGPDKSRYEGLELQALDKAGMPVATIAA
jgi:hypothetical protein